MSPTFQLKPYPLLLSYHVALHPGFFGDKNTKLEASNFPESIFGKVFTPRKDVTGLLTPNSFQIMVAGLSQLKKSGSKFQIITNY